MFFLGVIVGRGTSPVTFDTESFQERLRVIVGEIPEASPDQEKLELDFFKTLNKPVAKDPDLVAQAPENVPAAEDDGPIPVKVSRKLATQNRISAADPAAAASDLAGDKAVPKASVKKPRMKKASTAKTGTAKTVEPVENTAAFGGQYTIQVAAYKAFKDAVTQMSLLEKKGVAAYRVKGQANGTTWYRVRTGSFKDFQSAQAELNRLKQAKITGMIIKKDDP
jgi:cell division protein FtsN